VKQCIPRGPIWKAEISHEPYRSFKRISSISQGKHRIQEKFACSKQALMARTEFMARNKPICR
jgi:hypothetical protein